MDQLVTERTAGRHRIRVFHSRQLGEESQTIEQTRVGAIDLDRINVGAMSDVAPELKVLASPFLFRSVDHLNKVIDGPIGEEILGALEPYGFIGMTFYDSGARSIYTVRQPVRALADLKGMRIRVQQSDIMENMIRALGATPVALPYGQVLTALSTNLVDGAENNWPSFVATGHYKDGALLHGHRAHDGSGGAGHVAARLAGTVARGPHDLSRRRRAIRANTCAPNGKNGKSNRASRPKKAGVTHHQHDRPQAV